MDLQKKHQCECYLTILQTDLPHHCLKLVHALGIVPISWHTCPLGIVPNIRHTFPLGIVPNLRHTCPLGIVPNIRHICPLGIVPNIRHTCPLGMPPLKSFPLKNQAKSNATRFVKQLPLLLIQKSDNFFAAYLANCSAYFDKSLCYWAYFTNCLKWQKSNKLIQPPSHTGTNAPALPVIFTKD